MIKIYHQASLCRHFLKLSLAYFHVAFFSSFLLWWLAHDKISNFRYQTEAWLLLSSRMPSRTRSIVVPFSVSSTFLYVNGKMELKLRLAIAYYHDRNTVWVYSDRSIVLKHKCFRKNIVISTHLASTALLCGSKTINKRLKTKEKIQRNTPLNK